MLKVKKLSLRVVSQRVMAPTCQRKSSRAQRPSGGARISFGQGLWCRAAGGGDPVTPSPTHRHTQIPGSSPRGFLQTATLHTGVQDSSQPCLLATHLQSHSPPW